MLIHSPLVGGVFKTHKTTFSKELEDKTTFSQRHQYTTLSTLGLQKTVKKSPWCKSFIQYLWRISEFLNIIVKKTMETYIYCDEIKIKWTKKCVIIILLTWGSLSIDTEIFDVCWLLTSRGCNFLFNYWSVFDNDFQLLPSFIFSLDVLKCEDQREELQSSFQG